MSHVIVQRRPLLLLLVLVALLTACNLAYEERAVEPLALPGDTTDDATHDTAEPDLGVDAPEDIGDTRAEDTADTRDADDSNSPGDTDVAADTGDDDLGGDTDADDADAGDAMSTVCPDTVLDLGYTRTVSVTAGARALEAGDSVSFELDTVPLWDAGQLRVDLADLRLVRCRDGALGVLDLVVDPWLAAGADADDATTRLWFALQDDIAPLTTDEGYRLLYGNSTLDAPSPSDARAVFERAGTWRGAAGHPLAPDFQTDTVGGGTVQPGSDGLTVLTVDDAMDAALVSTSAALRADRQVSIRHEVELLDASTTLDTGSGLYALAIFAGDGAPTVQSVSAGDASIMVALTTYGGALAYRNTSGALHIWGNNGWGSQVWGATFVSLEVPRAVELDSDGTTWRLALRRPDGSAVVTTDPVAWGATLGGDQPLWMLWGDPYPARHSVRGVGGYTWVRRHLDDDVLVELGPQQEVTP